jgi:hypothetical protein
MQGPYLARRPGPDLIDQHWTSAGVNVWGFNLKQLASPDPDLMRETGSLIQYSNTMEHASGVFIVVLCWDLNIGYGTLRTPCE